MQVHIDTKEVDWLISGLSRTSADLEKVTVRTRKRALTAARQESIKGVRETYDTKAGSLRAGMRIDASRGTLRTVGAPSPLMDFKVSPTSPQRAMVRASVKKAGGRISYAFVARMLSGHVGVFARVAGSRKIRELYTVSSAQMAGEPKVVARALKRASEVYEERLVHELKYIYAKWG